jgi:hypothetical protein
MMSGSRLRLEQHLRGDVAGRDLPQCHHGGLVVLPGYGRFRTVRQPSRPLRGEDHELEDVVDVLEAIFDGDASHVREALG